MPSAKQPVVYYGSQTLAANKKERDNFWEYIKDRPLPDALSRKAAGFIQSAVPNALGVMHDPKLNTDFYYVGSPYPSNLYGFQAGPGYISANEKDHPSLVSEYGVEEFEPQRDDYMVVVYDHAPKLTEGSMQKVRSTLAHEARHRALKDIYEKNPRTASMRADEEGYVRLWDWIYGDYQTRQNAKNWIEREYGKTPTQLLDQPKIKNTMHLMQHHAGNKMYKMPLYNSDDIYDLPVE